MGILRAGKGRHLIIRGDRRFKSWTSRNSFGIYGPFESFDEGCPVIFSGQMDVKLEKGRRVIIMTNELLNIFFASNFHKSDRFIWVKRVRCILVEVKKLISGDYFLDKEHHVIISGKLGVLRDGKGAPGYFRINCRFESWKRVVAWLFQNRWGNGIRRNLKLINKWEKLEKRAQ